MLGVGADPGLAVLRHPAEDILHQGGIQVICGPQIEVFVALRRPQLRLLHQHILAVPQVIAAQGLQGGAVLNVLYIIIGGVGLFQPLHQIFSQLRQTPHSSPGLFVSV